MIISLDLDNVIRDSVGQIIKLAKQQYGAQLHRDQFNVWDPQLGHLLAISEDEFFQFAWCNKDVFSQAEPMLHVKRYLRQLAWRNRLIINTSNTFPDVTYEWLERWCIPADEVVHTNNKLDVEFDIHVDDSPHVLETLHNAGRKVIRFASVPWNAHLNGKYPHANNWVELTRMLEAL